MSGPRQLGKVGHMELRRILQRQGEGLHLMAESVAKDFEVFGQHQQRVGELVADLAMQVEAVKLQIAGILARLDAK